MSRRSTTLLILLACLVAGLALLVESERVPASPPSEPRVVGQPPPRAAETEVAGTSGQPRESLPVLGDRCGIEGRVVDPAGVPVADAELFLFQDNARNAVLTDRLARDGAVLTPVAGATTARDGSFVLALDGPPPAGPWDVRVVREGFADAELRGLSMEAGVVRHVGAIELGPGATLSGRVTLPGGGAAAGAEVVVEPTALRYTLAPTPGQERGLRVEVDGQGRYRLEHAPVGAVTVHAALAGHGSGWKTASLTGDHTVDLELSNGLDLGGIVVDEFGVPVSDALVRAVGLGGYPAPRGQARTGTDGRFQIRDLPSGRYGLAGSAAGHASAAPPTAVAGSLDLRVVLAHQGPVRLRILAEGGVAPAAIRVHVRMPLGGIENLGPTGLDPRDLRLGPDGIANLGTRDPGSYVLEVHADGFAPGFSEPFDMVAGSVAPPVLVRLGHGGVLEGSVAGSSGAPLPGVRVSTLGEGAGGPNALMGSGFVFRATERTALTDPNGRFRIELLSPGAYQLRLGHPEHTDTFVGGFSVQAGRVTPVPAVVLERGTAVVGIVRASGQPASGVRVRVGMAVGSMGLSSLGEAISGADGRFVMDKRIAPGSYQIIAARSSEVELGFEDMTHARTEFMVVSGQEEAQVSLTFPDGR